jgi:Nucleotidyl transferase AbiEii toxin, Type IV TA system
MKEFYKLNESRKRDVFNQVSNIAGIPPAAVEKDWWVTLILKTVFKLQFSKTLVFKGGTSLSKGYDLIERFSEDIDLAIDRSFFSFKDELKKKEITELRKKACTYFSSEFPIELNKSLISEGISNYEIKVQEFSDSDTDPVIIELYYESITEKSSYLLPKIMIEIGARSLVEPSENKPVRSIISEYLPSQTFSDETVMIPIVLPKRTFLEKAFLVHEELQRPKEKMSVERKSRHLYDLEKLMDTSHCTEALKDIKLYKSIVSHRKKYFKFGSVDYATHVPDKINFVPTNESLAYWKADYNKMTESMVYGEFLSFDQLIDRLTELRERFRNVR